ncbi:MAG: tetratricopeptide repeat protein, partial [Deltaproteobacteria bacterium]|nr:tetratricopeptide repeat protein [Nannocystaceae bacterium]
DPARARTLFEQLLVDEPGVFGERSEAHASTLMALAVLELKEGRLADAAGHLDRGRAIMELAVGSEGPVIATLRFDLGLALEQAGDLAGAQAEYTASLELFERHGHVDEIMHAAVGLASVAMVREDYPLALVTLERTAARVDDKADDGRLGQLLYFLAVAQFETGAVAEARATLDRAQPMIAASYGPESYRMGELLTLRGDLAEHDRNAHAAIELYREGVRMMGAATPLQHSSVGYAQFRLGQLHWSLGERRLAHDHVRAALATFDGAGEVATARDEVEGWLATHRDAVRPRGTKSTGPYR